MSVVRVVGRGRTEPMDGDALAALAAAFDETIVDVGTGDGRFAYSLASARPTALVVGIDAIDENMGEIAHKATRKPAKGGLPNLVLLRAAIEGLPTELDGLASEVHVVLPWGSLLAGVVLGRPEVVGGIARLSAPGARVSMVLNGEIWEASTPVRFEALPDATPEHVAAVVAPAFAAHGVTLAPARALAVDETRALRSTWAKKLHHGRAHPRFVLVEGIRTIAR